MVTFLKRTAAAAVGLALAASTVVGAQLPAQAATGCAVTFASYPTLSQGSKGAPAAAAECLLAQAGFAVSKNSSISKGDADQFAKFRTSVGLDKVRALGPRGWVALLSHGSKPSLEAGDKGAHVLRLQLSLRAGGYKVPANSTLDAATVKVLKAAQKSYKLPQSGQATTQTWTLLQSGALVKPASSTKGEQALAFAKKQLGDKYKYGAAGPDKWDCSGLTMKAWQSAGVKLPHQTKKQYKLGKKVAKSDLKKGDLVFFYSGPSHVGIYAGNGEVIHAPRPGKKVQYTKIKYMPWKGARRPG